MFVKHDVDIFLVSKTQLGFGLKHISRFSTYKKSNKCKKFNCIFDNKDLLKSYDYIIGINGNCLVLENIYDDILIKNDYLLVKHPGFYNRSRSSFTYENNKKSSAYIRCNEGTYYYFDYLFGGTTSNIIDLSKSVTEYIRKDLYNGCIAEWEDESYLNRYFASYPYNNILDWTYCWTDFSKIPDNNASIKILVKSTKHVRNNGKSISTNDDVIETQKPIILTNKEVITELPKIAVTVDKECNQFALEYNIQEDKNIEMVKKEKNLVYNSDKLDLSDLTFIIPVSLDSKERGENIELIIDYLQYNFNTNIIVGESDHKGKKLEHLKKKVKYIYFDYNYKTQFFHRTRMLNDMTKMCTTPFVANYDCDVFLYISDYMDSVNMLRNEVCDFIYPYNSHFSLTPRTQIALIKKFMDISKIEFKLCKHIRQSSKGGALFFNKEKFIEAGMENEKFRSWGPEDVERYDRFVKLGYNVQVLTSGHDLFHIEHPRGTDSNRSNIYFSNNNAEYIKIGKMTKIQLLNYIKTWSWI